MFITRDGGQMAPVLCFTEIWFRLLSNRECYRQVSYRAKSWSFEESLTVLQLLKRVDLLPESVLVVRNGQLVTEDQRLAPGDEVKIVSVISGG